MKHRWGGYLHFTATTPFQTVCKQFRFRMALFPSNWIPWTLVLTQVWQLLYRWCLGLGGGAPVVANNNACRCRCLGFKGHGHISSTRRRPVRANLQCSVSNAEKMAKAKAGRMSGERVQWLLQRAGGPLTRKAGWETFMSTSLLHQGPPAPPFLMAAPPQMIRSDPRSAWRWGSWFCVLKKSNKTKTLNS